mmetsp:Transcript_37323/g.90017  ORF Transcript_37323/g.90017 Transcript_37323/m.90017 type:complete len:218 (-) Transcript_37323:366-1019(-)
MGEWPDCGFRQRFVGRTAEEATPSRGRSSCCCGVSATTPPPALGVSATIDPPVAPYRTAVRDRFPLAGVSSIVGCLRGVSSTMPKSADEAREEAAAAAIGGRRRFWIGVSSTENDEDEADGPCLPFAGEDARSLVLAPPPPCFRIFGPAAIVESMAADLASTELEAGSCRLADDEFRPSLLATLGIAGCSLGRGRGLGRAALTSRNRLVMFDNLAPR